MENNFKSIAFFFIKKVPFKKRVFIFAENIMLL